MTVVHTTKTIVCRHCKGKLALKQATDGTWIVTESIKAKVTEN